MVSSWASSRFPLGLPPGLLPGCPFGFSLGLRLFLPPELFHCFPPGRPSEFPSLLPSGFPSGLLALLLPCFSSGFPPGLSLGLPFVSLPVVHAGFPSWRYPGLSFKLSFGFLLLFFLSGSLLLSFRFLSGCSFWVFSRASSGFPSWLPAGLRLWRLPARLPAGLSLWFPSWNYLVVSFLVSFWVSLFFLSRASSRTSFRASSLHRTCFCGRV